MTRVSISEARRRLPQLVRQVKQDRGNVVQITVLGGEDPDLAAEMAVTHQVDAAIEMRDVVRIDASVGLRVTAQRVVAHAKRSALRERAVDLLQVLAVCKLELGALARVSDRTIDRPA